MDDKKINLLTAIISLAGSTITIVGSIINLKIISRTSKKEHFERKSKRIKKRK